MRYRVFNKITKEDITDKQFWILTPNGELFYTNYTPIKDPNAMCISANGIAEFKKTKEALDRITPRCGKCIWSDKCSKDKDNKGVCKDYKRDPPDGGYYG